MKKVFLGLFLAGTMMSFTTTSSEAKTDFDEYGSCCTAIASSGTRATRCSDLGPDVACALAELAVAVIEIQEL